MDALSATFAALADPTRRSILAQLASGEKTEMLLHVALCEQMTEEQVREWLATGMHDGWSDTIDRLVTNVADASGSD